MRKYAHLSIAQRADILKDQDWESKVLKLNTKLNTLSVKDEEKKRLLSNAIIVFFTVTKSDILWAYEAKFIITAIIKLIILKRDNSNITLQLVYNNVNILPRLGKQFINFLISKLFPVSRSR